MVASHRVRERAPSRTDPRRSLCMVSCAPHHSRAVHTSCRKRTQNIAGEEFAWKMRDSTSRLRSTTRLGHSMETDEHSGPLRSNVDRQKFPHGPPARFAKYTLKCDVAQTSEYLPCGDAQNRRISSDEHGTQACSSYEWSSQQSCRTSFQSQPRPLLLLLVGSYHERAEVGREE